MNVLLTLLPIPLLHKHCLGLRAPQPKGPAKMISQVQIPRRENVIGPTGARCPGLSYVINEVQEFGSSRTVLPTQSSIRRALYFAKLEVGLRNNINFLILILELFLQHLLSSLTPREAAYSCSSCALHNPSGGHSLHFRHPRYAYLLFQFPKDKSKRVLEERFK